MSLREKLIEQKEKQPRFISVRDLQDLVTADSVARLLSCDDPKIPSPADQAALEEALPRARKLTAVLILARLEAYIRDIVVKRGITDEKVFPIGHWPAILPLSAEEMERIGREEWAVPLVLKSKHHIKLPRGAVLPYLRKERVNHGAFGIVYKVKIADGHLESDLPRMTEAFEMALKEVEVEEDKEEAVMKEVIAYRQRQHPNLVPLLASYTERRSESGYETIRVSMLFPFADMDMERWFSLPKTPTALECLSLPERRLRLYSMAAKLVSALAGFHREVGGLVASHHDLKPKNILIFAHDVMIGDLGMSNLAYLGKGGTSGADGAGGLGTKSYRPPEYYKGDSWERDETKTFGRAFDMWAMGCIMVQIAVLVVWGWQSAKLQEFRKARETFVDQDQRKRGIVERRLSDPDDSFVKSTPVVDEWLTMLQQEDGSVMLRRFLRTTVQMLRRDPSERIYSWEAELELHELLNPDEPRLTLSSVTAALVPKPPPGGVASGVETPLHRSAARGNLVRVTELLAAGWSAKQKDKMGRAASEVAGHNGQFYLRDLLLRASSIQDSGGKPDLRDAAAEPAVHVKEQIGFRLHERTPSQLEAGVVEPSRPEQERVPDILKSRGALSRTIVHEAAQRGDAVSLAPLLDSSEASKAVLLVDSVGMTPLHLAARSSADASSAILQAAASKMDLLLAKDQYGRIPIHLAVDAGKPEIVQVLLNFCRDGVEVRHMLQRQDQDGKTPWDVAWKDHKRIAQILQQAELGV